MHPSNEDDEMRLFAVGRLAGFIVCVLLAAATSAKVPQQGVGRHLASTDPESSYLSVSLDALATWLSGLAYLNPRFGNQEVHIRADWEDLGGSASPLVVHSSPATTPSVGSRKGGSVAKGKVAKASPDQDESAAMTPPEPPEVGPKHNNSSKAPRRTSRRAEQGRKAGGQTYRHRAQGVSGSNGSKKGKGGPVASGERASASLQELPMVALMFLTRGELAHEPTWRLFLETLPLKGPGEEPGWKRMFSLYVHPGENYSYSFDSLFHGSAIRKREKVEWGQFSVMQAERNLMEAALQQPLNQRFVLLSETCIPLYPATLVWAQLLSQPLSRIHACAVPNNADDEGRRMTYRMHQDMEQQGLKREHWRKSGQWIALNRKHAQAVVDDTIVSKLFRDECWVDTQHNPIWRFCVSDEHYVPTLLAFLGADNETDCTGAATNAWWDGPYYHPRTWQEGDVSAQLLSRLRATNNGFAPDSKVVCTSQDALESVRAMLPPLAGPNGSGRLHRRALMQHDRPQEKPHGVLRKVRAGIQLSEPLWMQLAVLQPGSLEWWQVLDDRGIDGDQLLEGSESTLTTRRSLQGAGEVVIAEDGKHWEAARGLLEHYRPMKDASCPLFARKFSASGAEGVAVLAKDFASSVGSASATARRH